MKYNYYIADVFTRKIFNGAQIAVFPHADGLNNQKDVYFPPLCDIEFAGHPIIAAAFVLGSYGDIELTETITPVIFEQNIGPVEVSISADQGKPFFVQFSHKVSSIVDRFAPTDEKLASFLSIQQSEPDHKKYSPRPVSCGVPYLIMPVWSYESVRSATFNYSAWSQSVAPQTAAQEILLFAPNTPFADSDFNARLLSPRIGGHEDPPIGSAMPTFASYLCSFEHSRKGPIPLQSAEAMLIRGVAC